MKPNNTQFDLSIIIPAKAEEPQRVANTLRKLSAFLKENPIGTVEVLLIVPEGDPSAEHVTAAGLEFGSLKILHSHNLSGKGAAVRLGMFEAEGRYRLFMDADLATPLIHLRDIGKIMQANAEVGIAVRDLWRIHKGLIRKIVTKTANLVVQILVLPGIKDSQCGFKVFSAKAAEEIFARQKLLRWSFDVEILKIARLLGYKIETFEAPDWKDPKAVGFSGESVFATAISEVQDPLKVWWRSLTGKYRAPSYRHDGQAEISSSEKLI